MVSKGLDKSKNTAIFRCFVVSICDVFLWMTGWIVLRFFSKSVSIYFGTPTAYYREWAACQSIVSYPPAPRDVVGLVKCGCNVECKGNCSYANNVLTCTPLCKCYAAGCSNHNDYHRDDQDEDMEEEDLD